MLRVRVKDEPKSLCVRCQHGLVMKGAFGQETTKCSILGIQSCTGEDPKTVPFEVRECSRFVAQELFAPNWMEQRAWVMEVKKGKPVGFITPLERVERRQNGDYNA